MTTRFLLGLLSLVLNVLQNPIDEARCGLMVPPRDPEDFYQMSKEEREDMGRQAKEYVEKFHNIAKLAERLEEILWQVVAKR